MIQQNCIFNLSVYPQKIKQNKYMEQLIHMDIIVPPDM
jgi:hypothetical protein